MRTTITVPDETFAEISRVAQKQHRSVSSLIAQFAARGLRELGSPGEIATDPITGLPTILIGRPITATEVAEAISE